MLRPSIAAAADDATANDAESAKAPSSLPSPVEILVVVGRKKRGQRSLPRLSEIERLARSQFRSCTIGKTGKKVVPGYRHDS